MPVVGNYYKHNDMIRHIWKIPINSIIQITIPSIHFFHKSVFNVRSNSLHRRLQGVN